MKFIQILFFLYVVFIVFFGSNCAGLQQGSSSSVPFTALNDYVFKPDINYSWRVSDVEIRDYDSATTYNIFMTSQSWLSPNDSSGYLWHHWLQITVPDVLDPRYSDYAFLYIDGGSNPDFNSPRKSSNPLAVSIALSTGTIVGNLYNVPYQPIHFAGTSDGDMKEEDEIIAYSWAQYFKDTNKPEWIAQLPMTKAGIRGLDTIQEFLDTNSTLTVPSKFVVAGASKRGWTSWLVASIGDSRVVGIAPLVAPIPNLLAQINEMYQSYNTFSFTLDPYVNEGIMGFLNLPGEIQSLVEIIDPRTYAEYLVRIPIYVIVASQDEFFMPDSARLYWSSFSASEQIYLWVVPNTGHSLAPQIQAVTNSITHFYGSVMRQTKIQRPSISWNIAKSDDGTTRTATVFVTMPDSSVNGNVTIVGVTAWSSLNNQKRDWRTQFCANATSSCKNNNNSFVGQDVKMSEVKSVVGGRDVYQYNYTIPLPTLDTSYSAFYVEVEIAFYEGASVFVVGEGGRRQAATTTMKITSDMGIAPERFPYSACSPDVCGCGFNCGKQSSDGDNTRTIVVIVVVVVVASLIVLGAIIAGGVYYYIQHQKRQGYVVL